MFWQAVFFDFDGVIVDSVPVKTEAFATLFRKYGPAIEKQVVDYHLAHGGVSRFEKFRYFYDEFLCEPVSEEELVLLGEAFSALVIKGVMEAPLISGVTETLAFLDRCGTPAFVVSGTPEEELRYIVRERGLCRWFKEVHGSPLMKHEMIHNIQVRYGLEPSSCLMIGDAMADYQAARATGCQFLGIVSPHHFTPFPLGISVSSSVFIP